MGFQALLESVIGSQALSGVVNLLVDITLALGEFTKMFFFTGIVVFVWGIFGFINLKKPGSRTTSQSVVLKLIFGPLLAQLSMVMSDITSSLWAGASPATATGYIQLANASQGNDPFQAIIYAVLALMTAAGWIAGGRALYGFSVLGDQNDKHSAFWRNLYMLIGAGIGVNLALTMMDVISSYSGASISTNGF